VIRVAGVKPLYRSPAGVALVATAPVWAIAAVDNSFVIGCVAAAAFAFINSSLQQVDRDRRRIDRKVRVDSLTRLGSKVAWQRARPNIDSDPRWTWVVCDGDCFKRMNDVHGHDAGDRVIAYWGFIIRQVGMTRKEDFRAFRPSGDEFAVAVRPSDAERVLREIETTSIYTYCGVTTKLSGAIGSTFRQADEALAAFKEARREANPSLRR
jgi:diguanylate cyclase (GGDEF)-like protein